MQIGLEVVVISGGEPLLESDTTFKLINYLHKKNIYIVLNASGILFKNEKLLKKLEENYPDLVVFSIDSAYSKQHNKNRGTKNVFELVIDTIRKLKSKGYPVAIRTVITKTNYKQLPKIIKDFNEMAVDCIKLTNIENDIEGNFRLSIKDLEYFDSVIRDRIKRTLKSCKFDEMQLQQEAIAKMDNLFNKSIVSYEELNKGFFSPTLIGNAKCDLKGRFLAIQSNGDVLPCCEAEHHYRPLLGNILETDLETILNSKEYKLFENNRLDYCITCTQSHNLQINFTRKGDKVRRR